MTTVPLARTGHRRSEVGPVELFFDLVYVFDIIQLGTCSSSTSEVQPRPSRCSPRCGGVGTTPSATNWLDPSRTAVQLLSGVLMLAALGMSVAIPSAFGDGAWLFVGCYLFMGSPSYVHDDHLPRPPARSQLPHAAAVDPAAVCSGSSVRHCPSSGGWYLVDRGAHRLRGPARPLPDPPVSAQPPCTSGTPTPSTWPSATVSSSSSPWATSTVMGGSIGSDGQLTPGLALSLIVGFEDLFVLW